MKRLLLYTIICMGWLSTRASNADSAWVEHSSLGRSIDMEGIRNPALHGAAYATSYSQLALGADMQWQSAAFVEEKGTGFMLPSIAVDTYLRLSERTAVWGSASYTTGQQRDIVWNSTSDYDLLQPYVLADTLGGDTRRERYTFSGGYASRVSRWHLGAEMLFRAEQEYRDQDPRMRGVITDLTLRLGAARPLSDYKIGAAFEANIYKQTNSVAFYNEEGVIPEYQMTGLGTEYNRFSGDKRSIYYDGGGVALLLNATPQDGTGLYADVSLDEHRYHRKLAEYNSMPLTDLYVEHAGLAVGWRRQAASRRLAVYGHVDYTKRTGDEHVGGTSDARYFPVIACLTMYKNNLLDASLGALYGQDKWNVALRAGYQNTTEEYVYPHRQLDYSHAYGEVKGQLFLRLSEPWLLTLDAQAAYAANISSTVAMPYANMDAKFVQMVNHKRDYAEANYTHLSAKARLDHAWKSTRYGLFAEVGGGLVLCSVGEHQTNFRASLGITF